MVRVCLGGRCGSYGVVWRVGVRGGWSGGLSEGGG